MSNSANNTFHFKQFSVIQEKSAMKVGTDGVLLGAWTVMKVEERRRWEEERHIHRENAIPRRILDIGTGTGVIALMLAQSFPSAVVEAIEIDHDAAEEAALNAANSPWAERIFVKETSLEDFGKSLEAASLSSPDAPLYDLIVCNPPFYNATLKPEDEARAKARHEDSLPYAQLVGFADRFLAEGGMFSLIYPTNNQQKLFKELAVSSLRCLRNCFVCSKEGKLANRAMDFLFKPTKKKHRFLCFGRMHDYLEFEELTIRDAEGNYTELYRALTNEFYLSLKP